MIGKAIFEGIVPQLQRGKSESDLKKCRRQSQVVEPSFAPFFLAKILGKHNSYYDLQSLDPAARKHCTHEKEFSSFPFHPVSSPGALRKSAAAESLQSCARPIAEGLICFSRHLQTCAGGDVADLCLNFVATGSDGEEIPLLPGGNGKEVSVTAENRVRYIYLHHGSNAGRCSSCST